MGHLDAASGVAGFIKTVLSLHHKQLVPTLHYTQPNPAINFTQSPFYVNTQLQAWQPAQGVRRAAVSSFGIGGTNVHMVLEEAPAATTPKATTAPASQQPQLLTLAAKSAKALPQMQQQLRQWLQAHPETPLANVAYTLQTARAHFAHRVTVAAQNVAQAIEALDPQSGQAKATHTPPKVQKVVFLFPGGGTQYIDMGKALYQSEPLFKQQMDQCLAIAQGISGKDYHSVLFPTQNRQQASASLEGAEWFQAIIFSFEYCLAQLLGQYGIKPHLMLGHSLGEYVAACISGVLSLEDALRLVILRGELSVSMAPGAMLGVPLSEQAVQPYLSEHISLAAVNGPEQCVVAGNAQAIEQLTQTLEAQGLNLRKLHISKAFHSHLVAPVLPQFNEVVSQISFGQPQVPYLSNVTGHTITPQDLAQPDYWARHFKGTVRFAQNLQNVLQNEQVVLIEVGPGRTLSAFARQYLSQKAHHKIVNLVRHPQEEASDQQYFMASLGKLWQAGLNPDWQALHQDYTPARVALPNYPFARIKYPLGQDVTSLLAQIRQGGQLQLPNAAAFEAQEERTPLGLERPELSTHYQKAQTHTQQKLCALYQNFFGLEKVGIHDDFFELGGDSLKAMTLLGHINKAFDISLTVPQFFKRTAVGQLAQYIDHELDPEAQHITTVPLADSYAISPYQQKLWLFSQLEESNIAYNIPVTYELRGRFDRALFNQAVNLLMERHEILRTVFANENGQVRQVVKSVQDFGFKVDYFDITQVPNQQAHAANRIADLVVLSFDLANGPLINASVFELEEEYHIFFFSMHHIVSDALSIRVFFYDLMDTYRFLQEGKGQRLDPLAVQFKDYSVWLKNQLEGPQAQKLRNYWLEQFSGPLPTLELPTERLRPPVKTYRGGRVKSVLDQETTALLHEHVKKHNGTMFMGLTAAVNALLYRYTGEEDIIVGTPISLRSHADLEHQIGFYLNTLALRTKFAGNWTYQQVYEEVKRITLDAYDHQIYPFDDLIDALDLKRDVSRSVLFDIMIIFQNVDNFNTGLKMGNLDMTLYETEHVTSKFDLTYIFNYHESEKQIYVYLEYNVDVFTQREMERMAGHLGQLVKEVVSNHEVVLNQIDYIGQQEKQNLLQHFNATQVAYPTQQTVVHLFEAQAAQTPDAVALSFQDQTMTFAQLNQAANGFAQLLLKQGVQPEQLVGIYVERSLEMMVGLLAILKAGAAFVPLDPNYPKERIALIVQDAGIGIILTKTQWLEQLSGYPSKKMLLDQAFEGSTQNPPPATTPAQLAYVIYTSGSTGKPKGVQVEHGNLSNFFVGMDGELGTDAQQKSLMAVTTISFDISILELFWTLTRGFKVVIQPEFFSMAPSLPAATPKVPMATAAKPMDFSLFYFASSTEQSNKYRLLLEGARFADQNGFSAIWTPERHFNDFGGIYPNPSVTGAAIAAMTQNIHIRSGSCVLPLRNPISVAEEWSVVDNLSNGRVGLSFASGWFLDDFLAFAPENYEDRHQIMYNNIETVRSLWKGNSITLPNPNGQERQVRVYPRPIQQELPVWVTAAGNPETFKTAGRIGANLLTHLLGQSVEELKQKIALYHQAWQEAGHKGRGHVSLMIHTFVGQDIDTVKQQVKEPFINYLRSSLGLIRSFGKSVGQDIDSQQFSQQDMEHLLEHAFNRYFNTAALLGTPESCLPLVQTLEAAGVNEIGCLIDFGVEINATINGFEHLNALKDLYKSAHAAPPVPAQEEAPTQSGPSIPQVIQQHGITHLQCTPSLMKILLAEENAMQQMQGLEHLMLGGEALPADLAQALLNQLPARLHNMYGPTETTIWSTVAHLSAEQPKITIGAPIANTQIYMLDQNMHLVPVGVPGQLYIGGQGVARGYLGNEALTQKRFVPNPFRPGERMYNTGDMARWLPNGQIEFLGRNDFQVKIRGFRIELEEIEGALKAHSAIKNAVVNPVVLEQGLQDLVAYVVTVGALNVRELKNHLRQSLPPYMVPAYFVKLEELPLTANGKVNRKALPRPEGMRKGGHREYVAPKSPKEKLLAEIWQNTLHTDTIGTRDDFYELGGDSIKSIQVISQIHQHGYTLSMEDLLRNPVLEDLAERVTLRLNKVDQNAVTGPVPLAIFQQYFFNNPRIKALHHYNMAITLQSSVRLSPEGLNLCFKQLTTHHDLLRSVYYFKNGQWQQEVKDTNHHSFEFSTFDLRQHPDGLTQMGHHCEALQANFVLEQGPLLKVALFQLQDADRLVIVAHHLIIDGVSWRILTQDLDTLYQQFLSGMQMALPPKTHSFKEWTSRLQGFAQSSKLQAEATYWQQVLARQPKNFPMDQVDPAVPRQRGNISFTLTQKATQLLQTRTSKFNGIDINSILLGTLAAALYEAWNVSASTLFIETHGREDLFSGIDITRTIGWFTGMTPFILEWPAEADSVKGLLQVHQALNSVPGKGLGYGAMQYLGKGFEHKLQSNITFNYLGDFEAANKALGQLFSFTREYHGNTVGESYSTDSPIEIAGIIFQEQLTMSINYATNEYLEATMQRLAQAYEARLVDVIYMISTNLQMD